MIPTDEQQIFELFAARDEAALTVLAEQYGDACRKITVQILGSEQDAEEILNDALLRMWNTIPPQRPVSLSNYLCGTVRKMSLQRRRDANRKKRGGGQKDLSLDAEPVIQIAAAETPESMLEYSLTVQAVNRFLRTLSPEACDIFLMRYGRGCSVREIAEMFRLSQSKVLVTLMRTRNRLIQWLRKEDLL